MSEESNAIAIEYLRNSDEELKNEVLALKLRLITSESAQETLRREVVWLRDHVRDLTERLPPGAFGASGK